MDPRNRADETLARARARGAFVVTPDNATSPMDAATTVRLSRDTIAAASSDPDRTPESTPAFPPSHNSRGARAQDPQAHGSAPPAEEDVPAGGWPQHDYTGYQPLPPNPYHSQRAPGEFGPLGSRAAGQLPPL